MKIKIIEDHAIDYIANENDEIILELQCDIKTAETIEKRVNGYEKLEYDLQMHKNRNAILRNQRDKTNARNRELVKALESITDAYHTDFTFEELQGLCNRDRYILRTAEEALGKVEGVE